MAGGSGKKRQGPNSQNKKSQDEGLQLRHVAFGLGALPAIVFAMLYAVSWLKSPAVESVPNHASTTSDIVQMEAELRSIYQGLNRIASTGDFESSKTIEEFAATAKAALENAANAKSQDQKREVLEKALAASALWIRELTKSLETLKETEDPYDVPQIVVRLNESTFNDFVHNHRRAMVSFYAPWCSHCKELAPKYASMAESFSGQAEFAMVDATSSTRLAERYKVDRYPTLKWFISGVAFDVNIPPLEEKIRPWIEARLQPNFQMIEADVDLSAALEASGGSASICHGTGDQESAFRSTFEMLSEHFRGQQVLFLWSSVDASEHEDSLVLLRQNHAATSSSTCRTTDEAVEWLTDLIGVKSGASKIAEQGAEL